MFQVVEQIFFWLFGGIDASRARRDTWIGVKHLVDRKPW